MEYEICIYEIDQNELEDLLVEKPFGFEILEKKENIWRISTDKKLENHKPIDIKKISYEEFDFKEIEPIKEDIFVVIPSYTIPINIKTGMAFGTGLHESTQIMLSFLKDFIRSYDSVLDVGCGSGILTIACAKLTKSYVKGIDIDHLAIKEAVQNAKKNNVDIYFELLSPEDIVIRRTQKKNPFEVKDNSYYDYFVGIYDVVLANLETDIFGKELKYLKKLFKKYLIISGVYKNEEHKMKNIFEDYNLKILKQRTKNDWHGFVLTRNVCF